MYSIKQIPSQDTFSVRLPVLRPGKPIESCIFDGDDLDTTAHFGIYDTTGIVGVVSIYKASSSLFEEQNQYQVRGMAILDAYQKKGLGEQLMYKAEDFVKSSRGQLMWFNAREVAVGFYKKMGYSITGELFNISDVGPHYVMYKRF